MEIVRYRSKVDWWIGVAVASVPIVALVTAVALQLNGESSDAVIGWVVLLAVLVLYAVIVWPVEYELHADELVVRFGLMRGRIPYRSIRGVRPSRSLLASPALSLDRLAIDTGVRLPVTISPSDRGRFLGDLAARTPHLVRTGDELISR